MAFSANARASHKWLTVVNDTNSVITNVYASPSGVSSWEEDVLGSKVIDSRRSSTITIDDGRDNRCLYDLKVVLNFANEVTRGKADVCGGFEWTIYDD